MHIISLIFTWASLALFCEAVAQPEPNITETGLSQTQEELLSHFMDLDLRADLLAVFKTMPPQYRNVKFSQLELESLTDIDQVYYYHPPAHDNGVQSFDVKQHIYRYEILAELGKGASGTVLEVYDHKRHEILVLKAFRQAYRPIAESEIKMLQLLNKDGPQPHIIYSLGNFQFKGMTFLILPRYLCDLEELRRTAPQSQLELSDIQTIARQVLKALKRVHSLGIIYDDLKPENILVKSKDPLEIALADFTDCIMNGTVSKRVTLDYISPEKMLAQAATTQSDMWTFGLMLQEFYNGHLLAHLLKYSASPRYFQENLYKLAAFLGNPSPDSQFVRNADSSVFKQDGSLALPRFFPLYPMSESTKKDLRSLHDLLRDKPSAEDDVFLDFIKKLLILDPVERMNVEACQSHPFITGESKADEPWRPTTPAKTSGLRLGLD